MYLVKDANMIDHAILGDLFATEKQNTHTQIKPLTLCKRLLYVSPYPCERVLRRVGWGGAGGS